METIEIENNTPYQIKKATEGSAAFDLCANRSCVISANETEKFNLGVVIHFPENIYAQILSRSGLACLHGIEVVGSGLIDSDYRKELICHLKNNSLHDYTICAGDRICQLVFKQTTPVTLKTIERKKDEKPTKRSGGFGSTGK